MLKNARLIWSGTACVIAAMLLVASGTTAQQQRTMVLSGGTLIDGTGKAPITDAVVVVRGNRITAVGKRGQVQIPAGANIIKTDGRTILPGLIDSHTHTQDFHMPLFLHYGVTTIQDKNNDPAWVYAQRAGLKSGAIKGPRMFVGGATLHATGFDFNTPSAKNAEDAAAIARSRLAEGADIVNVNQSINEEMLKAVIAVGKEKGVAIMGHVPNIRRAAELGYKYQEHMFMMGAAILDPEGKTNIGLVNNVTPEALVDPAKFPPLVALMVKQGVYVNPTLVAQWSRSAPRGKQMAQESALMAKDPALAFVPSVVRDMWDEVPSGPHQGYANIAEFVRQYAAAGGKVVVGTDSGYRTIAGLSEHYEMQMLADIGLTPMQIIQAATLWNAELIHQDKDLGSVEPGKLADFTIIEGDPLKDIRNTMNVRMVIKDGQVVDTKYDPKWVNPVPAPFATFTIDPPAITKVTPAVARQGGGTVTLEIEGSKFTGGTAGFSPNSIVRFDTNDLPTKFVSSTKLTATLDARLLQRTPGLYPLYVVTPGLHGTVSPGAYYVIDTADAPVREAPVPYPEYAVDKPWIAGRGTTGAPVLLGPNPRSARQGGPTLTLEIEGTKFSPNAIVRFDNEDLPTKFVSSTKLTATLDARFLQRSPGSYVVYVVNPGVYGTISHPGYFQVNLKN